MMRDEYPRPEDQPHEVEHEHDVVDDADRFDELPVYGPSAAVPEVVGPCPLCGKPATRRELDEQHACDRCYAHAYIDGLTERRRRH